MTSVELYGATRGQGKAMDTDRCGESGNARAVREFLVGEAARGSGRSPRWVDIAARVASVVPAVEPRDTQGGRLRHTAEKSIAEAHPPQRTAVGVVLRAVFDRLEARKVWPGSRVV